MKKISMLTCLILLCAAAVAPALEVSPLQLAVWGPEVQMCDQTTEIWGLRLNLPYGVSDSVSGLDLGIWGCAGEANALQVNFVNCAGALKGGQLGIMNLATEDVYGGQVALYNNIKGDGYGFQVGLFNHAREFSGVQFGFFNRCTAMFGVQIGIFNIIDESPIPFFPIVNGAF
jgi:hypothetical protein